MNTDLRADDDFIDQLTAYLDQRAVHADDDTTDVVLRAVNTELRADRTWSAPPATLRDSILARVREQASAESEAAQRDVVQYVAVEVEAVELKGITAEVTQPEVAGPEIVKPEAARPEPAETELAKPEIAEPGTVEPRRAEPEIAGPRSAEPEIVAPEVAVPEKAAPEIVAPGDAEPESVTVVRPARGQQPWWRARWGRLVWGVPVAATAAVVFTTGVIAVDRALQPNPPAAETYTASGGPLAPDARATISVSGNWSGFSIVLEVSGLPGAGPGSYYSAWLHGAKGYVPIGSFHERRCCGPIELWSGVDPKDYDTLVITLQAEGDPPTPSTLIILSTPLTH